MSNTVEIAEVTGTLRNLIETSVLSTADLEDTQVTVRHPGTARELLAFNQVNLFCIKHSPAPRRPTTQLEPRA